MGGTGSRFKVTRCTGTLIAQTGKGPPGVLASPQGPTATSPALFPQERPWPREGRGSAVRRGPLHGVHQGLAPRR